MSKKALLDADAWVFDLDNTLYPRSSNLFAQVDARMTRFVGEFLGLGAGEARRVQKAYFRDYGTTLRGLMDNHGLDPGHYLDFVHDIDLSPIAPDPRLDSALTRLSGRKILFTNGPADYAGRVLDRLGLAGHFDVLFDIAAADYRPKPDPAIYEVLIAEHGLEAERTVMVEDIARNLAPARALGMTTVWVRWDTDEDPGLPTGGDVHHVTDDLAAWLDALTGDRPAPAPERG